MRNLLKKLLLSSFVLAALATAARADAVLPSFQVDSSNLVKSRYNGSFVTLGTYSASDKLLHIAHGQLPALLSSDITSALGFTPANAAGQAFSGLVSAPRLMVLTTGAGTDQNTWDFANSGGTLILRAVNDANTAANNWLEVSRTGYVPTQIKFDVPTLTTAPSSFIPATSYQGTGVSVAKDYGYYQLNVLNDAVQGSTTLFGVAALEITHNVLAGSKGARAGSLFVGQNVMGADNNSDNQNYVAVAGREAVELPSNSSYMYGGTSAAPTGAFFGMNPVAELDTGNVLNVNAIETDVGAYTGTSTIYRYAYTAGSYGTVQGKLGDAAFEIGVLGANTNVGFRTGFLFFSADGVAQPLSSNGAVLQCYSPAAGFKCKAFIGIDLSAFDFTGGANIAFYSNGFSVSGIGTVTANGLSSYAASSFTGGVTIDALVVKGPNSTNSLSAGASGVTLQGGTTINGGVTIDALIVKGANGNNAFVSGSSGSTILGGLTSDAYKVSAGGYIQLPTTNLTLNSACTFQGAVYIASGYIEACDPATGTIARVALAHT